MNARGVTKKLTIAIFLVCLFTLTCCRPLFADSNIDKATRQIDKSIKEDIKKELPRPSEEAPEIQQEEKKEAVVKGPAFFIRKIRLRGCESISRKELRPILDKYEKKELSLDDLNLLAKEIEGEYLKKGIIAAVFVPPQKIVKGIVTLQVVESKMGELHVKDHKYFKKERLAYYWQPKADEVLRYDDISRSLQLMNKNPDREARASLHAGKKPETTDVTLDVDTRFPIHATTAFDREGSFFTGRYKGTSGIKHNNLLGFDDTLITGYSSSEHSDYAGIYAYHSIPITNFGTSMFYGHSASKGRPKKEYTSSGILSAAHDTTFFMYQDLFKGKDYVGDLYGGFDIRDKSITQNSGTANRDRLRILRFGGDFIIRGDDNVTYLSPEISQGLHGFGARSRHGLSSRNAKSVFSKLNLTAQHRTMLPVTALPGTQFSVTLKGQLATTKLMPQEQFYLGGIDSIRGYVSGDFSADNVLQANAELLLPAFFVPQKIKSPFAPTERFLKDDITLIAFFDYGAGKKRGADPSETVKRVDMASVGGGMRVKMFEDGLLRLEWGFPVGDSAISEVGDSRFHITFNSSWGTWPAKETPPLPTPMSSAEEAAMEAEIEKIESRRDPTEVKIEYAEFVYAKIKDIFSDKRKKGIPKGIAYVIFSVSPGGRIEQIDIMGIDSKDELRFKNLVMCTISDAGPFPIFPKILGTEKMYFGICVKNNFSPPFLR